MSAVFVVRPANGNDLEGIVEVGREAWPATYGSIFSADLVQMFLDKWWTKDAQIPAIRGGRVCVAEDADRIVGMTSYGIHQGRFVVWKLYVRPAYQGRGIGGGLLQAMCERAWPEYEGIALPFGDGNASAYDFARSHGFAEEYREDQGGLPDLIWMWRPLTADDMPASAAGSANAGVSQLTDQIVQVAQPRSVQR